MRDVDNFYLQQDEPIKGCLLALRQIILSQHKDISATWKYGMPFFCFQGKMFCYLWIHKKYGKPYIGMVEGRLFNHPDLISEKRSKMKIMLCDPDADLPIEAINAVLKRAIGYYQK
ncbi:MAG: DUF1801 domain-containing protein [Ferruginibacter sp.]